MLSIFAISFSFLRLANFFPLLSTIILNLEAVVPWLSCLSDISKLLNGKIMSSVLFWHFQLKQLAEILQHVLHDSCCWIT